MPTPKQLTDGWKAEMQLFGGDPKINGYPKSDDTDPVSEGGETIGTIELKDGDLKVTLGKEK